MEPKLSMVLDDVAQSMSKSTLIDSSCHSSVESDGKSSISTHSQSSSPTSLKKKPRTQRVQLPEKEFHYRQSPLTELLQVTHFRTIHHIFIASLILMMLHAMIIDLTETGTVDLGLERLLWALGEPQRTWTLIFSLHFSAICLLYPAFYYWANARQHYNGSEMGSTFDKLALAGLSIFMTLFTVIPGIILWRNPLPFGSAMVATMEQGRLLMKMYAFIRSNVPRALKYTATPYSSKYTTTAAAIKGTLPTDSSSSRFNNNGIRMPARVMSFDSTSRTTTIMAGTIKDLRLRQIAAHKSEREEQIQATTEIILNSSTSSSSSDRFMAALKRTESWLSTDNDNDSPCPCFTKYLYFLFAPTLIYRDQYPRTNKIRWNHVCWNFSQVVGCAFYASFILGRSLSSNFGKFGLPGHSMSLIELLQAVFSLMLPATLTLMLIFFMILHTWQNAFAEMLYFGDRLFYRDWWNCSSFAVYYKTWNILVHDWLYTYIFKDATEHGLGDKFKAVPTILVFVISSIFHEYILATSFHFFFPALLVLFGGFGFVFMFVGSRKKNSSVGNVLMWLALISGTGIIIAAYSMEHYARINCPVSNSSSSFFVPRTFACNAIRIS